MEKRLDLIQLLVSYGAEIRARPFVNVLLLWESTIIQFFIDNGADVLTGYSKLNYSRYRDRKGLSRAAGGIRCGERYGVCVI